MDSKSEEMKAFESGQQAYVNGEKITQSPYAQGGTLYGHWVEGFLQKAKDAK